MTRSIFLMIVIAMAACERTAPAVTASGDSSDPRFSSLISYLQEQMERYDIPGASIAIVTDGKLSASAGVGVKRAGAPDLVTPSTLFRVASLSKMVTAATAMRLTEEGRLDLTQPVTRYVPLALAAPFLPSSITTANLLTHTSGLPDFSVDTLCPTGAIGDWFASQGEQPLWSPPGALWNYSNQGFAAAGWIIEAASGQPFADAVTDRVFARAGMTSATLDPLAAAAGDHATGRADGENQEIDSYDCAATRPPGGVIASANDYAHFAETLFATGGAMLTPDSVTAMETAHVDTDQHPNGGEHNGYGLMVRDGYKGLHILRHEGSDRGYQASIWMVPASGFAVVVLYNSGGREPNHVSERAIDLYLDVADVAPPDDLTQPTGWGQYAGTYEDPFNLGVVDVRLDGSELRLSAPTHGIADLTLQQAAGDVFGATVDGKKFSGTFSPGPTGPAEWLVTREGVAARQ